MSMRLYDTNALLVLSEIPEEGIVTTDVSLRELENIKVKKFYDDELKYKARRAVNLLYNNPEKVEVIPAIGDDRYNSPDERIILTCVEQNAMLITNDKSMSLLADKVYDVPYIMLKEEENKYTGYAVYWIEDGIDMEKIKEELLINQYAIICEQLDDEEEATVRQLLVKRPNGELEILDGEKMSFDTFQLGDIRPLDPTQVLAFDSVMNNQITILKGSAGTGKTLIALAYALKGLEKGLFNRIVFFTNALETRDTKDIGALPGSKDDKLMDTSVGNMLGSKFGSKDVVYNMIDDGTLEIYPMNFIRGMSIPEGTILILDEGQNTSISLMKLCLQRVEEDCKVIITGDTEAQVDRTSFNGVRNGMRRVSEVLRGWGNYGEIQLDVIHRSALAERVEKM